MLPPLHRIDSPIEYVHPTDMAWDKEKIRTEAESAPSKAEHAWYRYHLGLTRYDVSLVQDYMGTEKPVVFRLRRLSRTDWMQAEDMARTSEYFANEYGLRRGLVSVKNGDEFVPLRGPDTERGILTDADCSELERIFGRAVLIDVGDAVRKASGDLLDAEKKPSAS